LSLGVTRKKELILGFNFIEMGTKNFNTTGTAKTLVGNWYEDGLWVSLVWNVKC
jgi:hypothetical protein